MADPRIVTFEGKTYQFPSDATDAEVSAALGGIPAANAAQAPKAKTWTDWAVSALPVAGGIVGATLGGPAGAALGAAGGEAWRQNINRMRGAEAPETATDAALGIGIDAAISGATAGIPAVAGKIVKSAGPTALRTAAKVVMPGGARRAIAQTLREAADAAESKAAQAATKGATTAAQTAPAAPVAAAPSVAAPAAAATEQIPAELGKMKMSLEEFQAAQAMAKRGIPTAAIKQNILALRAMRASLGTPSNAQMAEQIAARNAAGTWK